MWWQVNADLAASIMRRAGSDSAKKEDKARVKREAANVYLGIFS